MLPVSILWYHQYGVVPNVRLFMYINGKHVLARSYIHKTSNTTTIPYHTGAGRNMVGGMVWYLQYLQLAAMKIIR